MKLLIAVLIVCVVAANAFNFKMDQAQALKECETKYKIDHDVYHRKGSEFMLSEKKYRCFGACLLTKIGMFNENGEPSIKILEEAYEAKKEQSNLDKFNKCITKNKNSDFCEQVLNTAECINREIQIKH